MEFGMWNKEDDGRIRSFRDLDVWKEGHKLVVMVYKYTQSFPAAEMYGITSQMRRCAVSITSNIAEGFGRQSFKEKVQFYSIARGSLIELENQIVISRDVGFLNEEPHAILIEQLSTVHMILNGLLTKTRSFL